MGFMDSMGSSIGPAIGTSLGTAVAGPIGGALGSAVGNLFGQSGKTKGIPSPLTGAQMGQSTLDYMNTAFPGTTPQERLGSSAASTGGGVNTADMSSKTQIKTQQMQNQQQQNIQNQQLFNSQMIADKQARSSIIGSSSMMPVKDLLDRMKIYNGQSPQLGNDSDVQKRYEADTTASKTRSPFTWFGNSVKTMAQKTMEKTAQQKQQADQERQQATKSWILNNDKVPRSVKSTPVYRGINASIIGGYGK